MAHRIFIDGHTGTTALQITARLSQRSDIDLIRLAEAERKKPQARKAALQSADIAILCLPDTAAREAVAMAQATPVRIIDASTAHRVAPGWVYGLPELAPHQPDAIRNAQRLTNPGCYSSGAILLLAPLVRAGILAPDCPVTLFGISGYTGGGKQLICEFETARKSTEQAGEAEKAGEGQAKKRERTGANGDLSFGACVPEPLSGYVYALSLQHKHIPEITLHSGLAIPPLFVPSVGNFPQGMIVMLPLHRALLAQPTALADITGVMCDTYRNCEKIIVRGAKGAEKHPVPERLLAGALAGTDDLMIHVFADNTGERYLLAAVLDNLGKGAAGVAVQNLKLMLQQEP